MNLKKLQDTGFEELRKHFLETPDDVNVSLDETGGTSLHYAAWGNYLQLAHFLLEELKVNASIKDDEGGTALHFAAYGAPEIVKLLLSASSNVNEQDDEGNTPLHFAIMRKQIGIVELLLKSGSSIQLLDNEGVSPLGLAKEMKDEKLINILEQSIA